MLVLLSRELWKTLRHCTRNPAPGCESWHWLSGGRGNDVLLGSGDRTNTLSSVLEEAAGATQSTVSIVAASSKWSGDFETLIEALLAQPGDLRISLMVTSRLDEAGVESCRSFLRNNTQLAKRVSTLFLSARFDTDLTPLEPATVSDQYSAFLRLICSGGESFANTLGLFRRPANGVPIEADDAESGIPSPFPNNGVLAALGVRSWVPKKEKIVELTEKLLSRMVAAEETNPATVARIRNVTPDTVLRKARQLGLPDDSFAPEALHSQVPELPPSPAEHWRIPLSREQARRKRHRLGHTMREQFSNYTASLNTALEEIVTDLHRRKETAFAEAANAYRSNILQETNLGTLNLLVHSYFPAFRNDEPLSPPDPGEEILRPDWMPDDSYDCFCGVRDTLDEGMDKLPRQRTWLGATAAALMLFAGAWMFKDAHWLASIGFGIGGFAIPAALFGYRAFHVRELRKELVRTSDEIFLAVRKSFDNEVAWNVERTQALLDEQVRNDAATFEERLRKELVTIPWLTPPAGHGRNGVQEEIQRLRSALIEIGVDEKKLDRLPGRLQGLAQKIVERARQAPSPDDDSGEPEPTPGEKVQEWIDELIESSILPLNNGNGQTLKEEILEVAGTWRSPAIMAPLTDAELHRGYKKVIGLPDTHTTYQELQESLPCVSGNPVVTLDAWSGPLPGVAICSVVTGLPDSILDQKGNSRTPQFGQTA